MRRRGELLAIVVAALAVVVFLIGFFVIDTGQQTAPVDRVDEQNIGSDAPHETVVPPDGGNPTAQQRAPDAPAQ